MENQFQSPPPARGATRLSRSRSHLRPTFQSPPPARGPPRSPHRRPPPFQSPPPARGATIADAAVVVELLVSIPAPRAGGDIPARCHCTWAKRFNPSPPRGGRPGPVVNWHRGSSSFNPRPPHGGRQAFWRLTPAEYLVSIPAPRAGGDLRGRDCNGAARGRFNPRPPRGGRRGRGSQAAAACAFQSPPPARGATRCVGDETPLRHCFNPRPPRGGRRPPSVGISVKWNSDSGDLEHGLN